MTEKPHREKYRASRPDTKHCDAPDCVRATCGRKNFCSKHLMENPYILDLLARIEARGGTK